MKKALLYVLFLLIFSLALDFMGCASSKPKPEETSSQASSEDDYREIEKLLGINREEQPAEETAKKEEKSNDDLLKLLEADEGKGKKTTTTEEEGAPADRRLVQMQEEIKRLKKQLNEKNIQIAELKAQLSMKNEMLKQQGGGTTTSFTTGTTATGLMAPSAIPADDYERQYQQGLQLFNSRKYRDALRIFESLVASDTNHSLSDNAQYWTGECYFALGDYRAAILAFEKVFTFRQSNKNDYAQYKLGLCYYRLGDRERARQEFQNLLDNYPDSPLVEKAQKYLLQL